MGSSEHSATYDRRYHEATQAKDICSDDTVNAWSLTDAGISRKVDKIDGGFRINAGSSSIKVLGGEGRTDVFMFISQSVHGLFIL